MFPQSLGSPVINCKRQSKSNKLYRRRISPVPLPLPILCSTHPSNNHEPIIRSPAPQDRKSAYEPGCDEEGRKHESRSRDDEDDLAARICSRHFHSNPNGNYSYSRKGLCHGCRRVQVSIIDRPLTRSRRFFHAASTTKTRVRIGCVYCMYGEQRLQGGLTRSSDRGREWAKGVVSSILSSSIVESWAPLL